MKALFCAARKRKIEVCIRALQVVIELTNLDQVSAKECLTL